MSVKQIIEKILNKVVRNTYWYNHVAFPNCHKFWSYRTFDTEIVNLGSTAALHAFDYSNFSHKAVNFAMEAQTFREDYEILRNYSSFLKEQAIVFIPLCPFSSLGGSRVYFEDYYYSILNIASIPNSSYKKYTEVMNVMNSPYKYISIYGILQGLFKSKNNKSASNEELEKDALSKMNSWKREFSISDWNYSPTLSNIDAYNDSQDILKEILSYCERKKYRAVIVIPPVSPQLSKLYNQEKEDYYIKQFIEGANIQGVPVVNLLRELNDNCYFANSIILTQAGANAFMNELYIKLQNLSILQ